MLNLTMRQDDDVLLYDKPSGKLLGVITCDRTGGNKPAAMQFRINDNIVVLRKALVTRITDKIDTCPESLLHSFGNH